MFGKVQIVWIIRTSAYEIMQSVSDSAKYEKKTNIVPIVALLVVVVVLGGAFGYYYMQATSQISSLKSQNSNLNSQITSIQNEISNDKSQIASLESKITADNASISTLQSQNSSDQSKISSLEANITEYQSELSSLNSQVGNLSKVTNLSIYSTETASQQITAQPYTPSFIGPIFNVSYAGYVIVSISGLSTFSTQDVFIGVVNNLSSSVNSRYGEIISGPFHPLGTSDNLIYAVLPGTAQAYVITNATGSISATFSVVYYS